MVGYVLITPTPKLFYSVKKRCQYLLFSGSIVKGSVNFHFLPDWRCSMVACGGSISNVSYNVSIASSSCWDVLPGSSSHHLLIWFRCLLCVAVGPRMIYAVFTILWSIIPSSQKDVLLLQAFVSWVISFCGNSRGPVQTCLLSQQFFKNWSCLSRKHSLCRWCRVWCIRVRCDSVNL